MPLSFILPLLPTYVKNTTHRKSGELCSRVRVIIDNKAYSRKQLTEDVINTSYVTLIDSNIVYSRYPTRGHLIIFCNRKENKIWIIIWITYMMHLKTITL